MKKLAAKLVLAFTLAEVLITLGIIGIVAEITIPTLIANTQKQEYITSLKKAYTEFNQALAQMAIDNGCPGDLRCTGLFDASTPLQTTGDTIASYFKVSKNCGTNTGQGCFSNSVSQNYDGSGGRNSIYNDSLAGYYRFITIDNISFLMTSLNSNCGTNYGINSMANTCAWVYIDINGLKGPNNWGRDIHYFYITNGKGPLLYPQGGKDVNTGGTDRYWKNYPGCTSTVFLGSYCAGRIMEESWQMNY